MERASHIELRRLAAAVGVVPEWVNAWGKPCRVRDDHLLAVIESVTGCTIRDRRDVTAVIRSLQVRPPVEPVTVAWDGRLGTVRVPPRATSGSIITEFGEEIPLEVGDGRATTSARLPIGYHQIHVSGVESSTLVISAPAHAHPAPTRSLGLFAPTYSLRPDPGDIGIGHLGTLDTLGELGAAADVSIIGTLPLLATFPDQPSPYAPASRRAWNELLIDLSRAPGWVPADDFAPPRDPLWVDYERVGPVIRGALARYAATVRATPGLWSKVESSSDAETRTYAKFRATADAHGRNWRAWPNSAEPSPERETYHLVTQWLATSQLADLGGKMADRGQMLYLDLPVGCHPDGYDVWGQPEIYAPASVGAPPDTLFAGGQDWGLPAVIPRLSRRTGHSSFIKALRHQMQIAGLLRIDHVMGLYRSWWVPHGAAATSGAYVLQPSAELFAIVCLESVRNQTAIVGENLGTVPPEITAALHRHRLLGMRVAEEGIIDPTREELITLSTHDTPPFAAWWHGTDITDMDAPGPFDAERAAAEKAARIRAKTMLEERFASKGTAATLDAIHRWMAASPAPIALVSLDDLLGETRRHNIPGTNTERPNWRTRAAQTLAKLAVDERFGARLSDLAAIRTATGRSQRAR